jgi:predicted transcriptional regulator
MAVMVRKKEVLYVEVPADLKKRLVRLAETRARKISAEATLALERYVREEEQKEGLAEDED